MGKTGRWFKSFLGGKTHKGDKDPKKNNNVSNNTSISADQRHGTTQVVVVAPRPTTPKEKKRWSFRRSSTSNNNNNNNNSNDNNSNNNGNSNSNGQSTNNNDTANAAVSTVALPKNSETPRDVTPIVSTIVEDKDPQELIDEVPAIVEDKDPQELIDEVPSSNATVAVTEDEAAVRIQAVYRSYLARKALKALRGLVKLQALVRGHLVRKQATATLRCMQALVTAQARARAQRVRSGDEVNTMNHRQYTHRCHNLDRINHDMEENIKIVEMDRGEFTSTIDSISSHMIPSQYQNDDRMDNRMSLTTYYSPVQGTYTKQDYQQYSPAPSSAVTDFSPRTFSGHFEDYCFTTAQSSPQCYSAMSRHDPSRPPFSFPKPDFAETMSYDFPLYPNYMANTKSSRAKVRSQSAPKQRPELERQPSRGRRPSVEGRNIPKGAKMQRSSSQVGATAAAHNYQYPWSVKLDKSIISLRDSECGSSCSVATNAYYSRSVVSYDPRC